MTRTGGFRFSNTCISGVTAFITRTGSTESFSIYIPGVKSFITLKLVVLDSLKVMIVVSDPL